MDWARNFFWLAARAIPTPLSGVADAVSWWSGWIVSGGLDSIRIAIDTFLIVPSDMASKG